METVTERHKPHHGGESAAIALTAQLLSGLKVCDAVQLLPAAPGDWWFLSTSNFGIHTKGGCSSYIDRDHDHRTPAWRGEQERIDGQGRIWSRGFRGVQDDFGNLVEVAP